jgi:hypothetical protein
MLSLLLAGFAVLRHRAGSGDIMIAAAAAPRAARRKKMDCTRRIMAHSSIPGDDSTRRANRQWMCRLARLGGARF